MRLRIKQARPTSLNDAVRHAVELEAFNKAERKTLDGQTYLRSVKQTDDKHSKLQRDVEQLQKAMVQIQKLLQDNKSNNSCNKNEYSITTRKDRQGYAEGRTFRNASQNPSYLDRKSEKNVMTVENMDISDSTVLNNRIKTLLRNATPLSNTV